MLRAAAVNISLRSKHAHTSYKAVPRSRRDPHDAAAHFCMGFAFLSTKRFDEAIGKFRQGLLYKPEDAEAHFGRGSALAAQGKRDEALTELREALRLLPNHRAARQLLYQLEN
jgi:tetratricopeptide (TPR) repeat protein